jgi:hypothetical protein
MVAMHGFTGQRTESLANARLSPGAHPVQYQHYGSARISLPRICNCSHNLHLLTLQSGMLNPRQV